VFPGETTQRFCMAEDIRTFTSNMSMACRRTQVSLLWIHGHHRCCEHILMCYNTVQDCQLWLRVKVLCPTQDKRGHFGDVLHSQSLNKVLTKLNLTQQKQKFIRNTKIRVLQHQINTKKLKTALLGSYDHQPGNRAGCTVELLVPTRGVQNCWVPHLFCPHYRFSLSSPQ